MAALWNVAEHVTIMIPRDRIVCRIRDKKIQQRLLVEKELAFAKAYEIAISIEITFKNMAVLRKSRRTSTR